MPVVRNNPDGSGHRWFDLDVPEIGRWTPSMSVSIIVPYFEAPDALEITLAALAEQTYPDSLVEVLIVDDGSEPPLAQIEGVGGLRVRVLRQENLGFGLARARNRGAAEATGEILVFLDCDMVPESTWLEAHARWHHEIADAVTLGFRRHVDFDGIGPDDVAAAARAGEVGRLFDGRKQEEPEWIEFHMSRTGGLTSDDDDLFRVVTGGNLAIRAETFQAVAAFDESFTQWGAEDTELGYRLFNYGAELIPERGARCWHQGLGNVPDPAEKVSLDEQRAKISHLIADSTFRRWVPGRSYLVPYAVVRIEAAGTRDEVERCVESVLASRFHDLIVSLHVPSGFTSAETLQRAFEGDPRVVVNGESPGRYAAVTVDIPATLRLSDRSMGRIVQLLRGVGELRVGVPGGDMIVAQKRRAARFVERRGDTDLGAVFGVATASARDVGVRSPSTSRRRVWERFSENSAVGKATRRLRQVRSWRDLGAVARWLGAGVRHRLLNRRFDPAKRTMLKGSQPAAVPSADGWIDGFRVLATNQAMLPGAGYLVGSTLPDGRIDLVITEDSLPDATRLEVAGRGGVIVRDSTIVAVDTRQMPASPSSVEPVRRAVAKQGGDTESDRWLGGLGLEVDRLDGPAPDAGVRTPHLFVADHPALHRSRLARARYLAETAALGLPIVAERPDALEGFLDRAFIEAMENVAPERLIDQNYREMVAVNLRRAALGKHGSQAVVRRLLGEIRHRNLSPSVSVVLVTNRGDYLAHALQAAMSQDYEDFEVIVALHGDLGEAAEQVAASDRLTVLQFAAETPFGEVLNRACAAAGGDLVAKIDDDDWYGPHHISDLVLAHTHSRAQLVGKGAEFVYLDSSNKTIRRFVGGAESHSRTLAGGCLLISRADLRDVGGWRSVERSVDKALIEDVASAGGTVYRTHGFEYVLNRHGQGHTWDTADRYFADQAEFTWEGLQLEVAGIYSSG